MRLRSRDKSRYFLESIGLLLLGCLLACFLHHLSFGSLTGNQWGHFFIWQYAILVVGSSLVLRIWILLGLSRNAQRSCHQDMWTYLTFIPVLFTIVSYTGSDYSLIWIGVVYIGILIWKSTILVLHLFKNLQPRNMGKWSLYLFLGFFWFFASYGAWLVPSHDVSGDEPHYLLMTHSLTYDGDLNLFDEYQAKQYSRFYSGKLDPKPSDLVDSGVIRSRGLGATYAVFLIPGYLVAGYPGAVLTMILCAAFLMTNSFQLFLKTIPNERSALVTVLLMAVSLPFLNYSCLIYPDILAALLLVIGLRVLKIQPLTAKHRAVPLYLFLISAALILLKFRYVTVVVLLLAAGVFTLKRRGSKRLLYAVSAGLIFGGYLTTDILIFSGDLFFNRFGGIPQLQSYLPDLRSLLVVPGFILDQEAGFLFLTPVFFLTLPGLIHWPHRKDSVYWISLLALPLTCVSLLGHFAWHCLPTPPLRYLIPILPAFCLFGVETARQWDNSSKIGKIIGHTFIVYSIIMSIALTVQPDWQINLADGTNSFIESIGVVAGIPLTSILPSLIRPSLTAFVWSGVFLIMAFLLLLSRRWRKPTRISPAYSVTVLSVLMASCMLGLTGTGKTLYRVEAEDRFLSHPSGGEYFPAKRDPFFHQENQYGWSCGNNDSLHPCFQVPEGKYICLIRAMLLDHPYNSDIVIKFNDKPIAFVTVTNSRWADYALPVEVPSGSDQKWQITVNCPRDNRVSIDRMDFNPCGENAWRLYSKLSVAARLVHWNSLEYFAIRQGFLHHPGDPWYGFRAHFNPGSLLPIPLPEKALYPLKHGDLDRTCDLAIDEGWSSLIALERLFSFSAAARLPDEMLREYYLQSVALRSCFNLKPDMITYASDHPEDQEMKLALAMAEYSDQHHDKAITYLSQILFEDWPFMSLTQPDRAGLYTERFGNQIRYMTLDPRYIDAVDQLLDGYFRRGRRAFRSSNLEAAAEIFFAYYKLDADHFREHFLMLNRREFITILSALPDMFVKDYMRLCEILIAKKRYEEALACAERALKLDPDRSYVRYSMARSLFHNLRFEEAQRQCLIAVSMDFQDDRARGLWRIIQNAAQRRSELLGLPAH
jgi:tetratricopeptide (TPR) repeat protein